MDFEVRHADGTTVKLISSAHRCAITSATQTRKLCGNDTVTINLQSATYIEFQVGDKITIFGTTYTLNQLPTVKKESERSYTYTLVFEGLQYTLIDRVFLMPDNTQGDNLMFDLAGMLRELATNINRGNSGKQYEFVLDESLEETEYKNLSLTGKNCLQVLQQLCQEWDTEFVFAEEPTRIAIYIGVAGSTFAFPFTYGRGGGVYELNREKGASDICTRLFVYGGTQNLTYYRHNRLCLPSKEKNQSYVEDATAQAVYGIKEQVKNFDDIYPNRIGTITSLSGCDYNEFIDNDMADEEFGFDLNEKWANNADDCAEWLALKGLENTEANRTIYYNDVAGTATKYLMAGATAKIHFNTGALAGYECDLHSYTHSNQKFVLKPLVDENGYDFPSKTNAAFKLAVGDEYVILDINLPTAYKEEAESKLATEAASYFDTVCRPQPKYTLTIEPIALKHIVGPSTADTEIFKVGDLINISDPTGGVESATIRIDQFVRNLLDPFDYKLTLTDEITYSQQVRTLIEVDAIKRVVEESKIYDVNRIRRGWKDAEELYNQMFDTEGHYYSEKIAPLSIDTQMLKVGARSQQLVLQNVLFQPNYNANPAKLQISAGSLVHYTIAEPDIKTWTMSAYSGTNVPSTAQSVYAKCAKNGTTGTWLVTDQAIVFDSDPSYYHFLVGSLSSVDSVSNTRNFAATYGFTTINGRNITTGVIKSSNGSSVVIDLDAGIIKGNITFESGTTSYDALQGIISGNSTVKNAQDKFGTCSTAGSTAAKAVTLSLGTLTSLTNGAIVTINFSNANTAANPTLNVNSKGAKAILSETGSSVGSFAAGTYTLTYNGTAWVMSAAAASASAAAAATAASAAQTTAERAEGKIDGLEIGGTNLLRTTAVWEQGTWTPSTGAHSTSTTRIRNTKNGNYIPIETGKDYIFTRHTLPSASKIYEIVVYAYDSNGAFVSGDSKTSWQGTFPLKYKSATATRIEIGIRHTDNSAITADEATTAKIKLEQGNKATDWSPAPEDVEAEIATERARLDNIDDDDVFSISEKQNYRIDFEKITGVHATTIPEAATMIANPSTYANGSFMQHYSKISETAENTLNALKTAYTNLRTFLNTVGLYTNSDYDNFSRTNMATYVAAYLNAEAAIDLYAESVSELTATSDTAEGTAAKALTITKPAGVTDSMLQDMLADTAMRLHVKFTNRNASRGVGFGLPVTPTGVSSATARFSYGGATASQECYWPAGMEIDLRLLDKTSSYVTYVAVDESNLRQFVMFSNAMEADGGVYGGLALLSLILLRNKAGQQVAGLNGLEDSSLAFWAGGALEDALKDNVPVWIKRDGNAKFGNLAIQKSGTIQFNSNGVRRFEIRNGSASVQTGYVTYNTGNSTNNPPVWSSGTDLTQTTITGTESSPQTHTAFAIQDLGHDALQTFQDVEVVISAEISMVCSTLGTGGYATAGLEIYSEGEWQAVPDSKFTHSFDSTGQWVEHTQTEFVALYTSQTLTQQVNTSKIGLRVVFYKDSEAGTVAIEVSNIKWHYFQDTSKAKTIVGTNGMIAYVNSNNMFRAASLDNDQSLTTTIKGNTDIPGVLWAGNISSGASVLPHYKNAAKYASSQLECDNWNSTNKYFRITHRLGTGNFTAMVTPTSSAVTARTTKDGTYLYVYLSAQASFDLVLFGTN